jgi:hypothetical protein
MPEPSGSQAAPRSGPRLKVNRTGGAGSKGWSVPVGGVPKGSVCPHPRSGSRSNSACTFRGSGRTATASACVTGVSETGDNRDGDAHLVRGRTGPGESLSRLLRDGDRSTESLHTLGGREIMEL